MWHNMKGPAMSNPVRHFLAGYWRGLLFALVLCLPACQTPQKLTEAGRYDRAIDLAVSRLAGRRNKDPRDVAALQDAFAKANERDLRTADRLKRGGRPEDWPYVYDLYDRVLLRQDKVRPLLPLFDRQGREAVFEFVPVERWHAEARNQAAEYVYGNARRLLALGHRGDKLAARQAYAEFGRLSRYYLHYRDSHQLAEQARQLGVTHILFEVSYEAPTIMPFGLERELADINTADLNRDWQQYYLHPVPGVSFDYQMLLRLTRIEVSPEVVRERHYEDTKEIEDGFEYALDDHGNVRKDSQGNDIRVPRWTIVRASVREVEQHKAAVLEARLDIFETVTGMLLDSQPIVAETVFEHVATTFSGDRRALSRESRGRIGNQPLPFPSNDAMILEAAAAMRATLPNKIANSRAAF